MASAQDLPRSAARRIQWAYRNRRARRAAQLSRVGDRTLCSLPNPLDSARTEAASECAGTEVEYDTLVAEKRAVKARLRRYDQEFVSAWGREPAKKDKEVMRPLYGAYNEVVTAVSYAFIARMFTCAVVAHVGEEEAV
jgi:hypothetical protein